MFTRCNGRSGNLWRTCDAEKPVSQHAKDRPGTERLEFRMAAGREAGTRKKGSFRKDFFFYICGKK